MGIFTRLFGERINPEPQPVNKDVESVDKLTVSNLGVGWSSLWDSGITDAESANSQWINAFNDWVYANVSVLAEQVSYIDFELYKIKFVRGEISYERIESHELLDLLDRFNPFMAKSDAIYTGQAHVELAGDAFMLLDGAGKDVNIGRNIDNIFLLQPDMVEVKPGDRNSENIIDHYIYKDKSSPEGKRFEAEEVIQIKSPNPGNPLRGKSVVQAAAIPIDVNSLLGEFNKKFFKNGAIQGFVLGTDQKLTADDVTRMESQIKKNYAGVRNAFKTMILGGGLKPISVQSNYKDMEFLAQQEWIRDKIMALFRNTKTSLGITDDVNRANAEASLLGWKQNVIKPKMRRWADTLNEFLVPRFGNDLILTYADPVPEDREGKIKEAVSLSSILSINERRELVGFDNLPGKEYDEVNASPAPQFDPAERRAKAMPKTLSNIDLPKVLRARKIHDRLEEHHKLLKEAKKLARVAIRSTKKPAPKPAPATIKTEVRESPYFTNDQVWEYWAKTVNVADVLEERFIGKVKQFIDRLEEKALTQLQAYKPTKGVTKALDLFDDEAEISAAIDLFTPLMAEATTASGQQTFDLLKLDQTYTTSEDMRRHIRRQVERFAGSMVKTDQDKLSQLIITGFESGQSVPQIERNIRETFEGIRKVQSTRITRTELIRASNNGALDAFRESGVVEGKQWLTAEDDRTDAECMELNGKVVALSRDFYEDDYDSGEAPPLHPNCRCILIPVLKEVARAELDKIRKELEQEREYVNKLEKVFGLDG